MIESPDGTYPQTQLRLDEAVLLCHALTSHVADQAGVQALFIKGPVTVMQGLRKPKQSVDVDVLVEPSAHKRMLAALQERGWELRPVEPDTDAFPRHSETLFHRSWPVDIDLHYRFPGMEREPAECFEIMWEETETHEVAGHLIQVPTKAMAVCVLALHSLRTPWTTSSRLELENLISLPLQNEQRDIIGIAERIGATAALKPFIDAAFGAKALVSVTESSAEWTRRTGASAPGASRAIALISAPWHRKPRLILNAVFPSKATLLAKDIYADVSFSGRVRLYRDRWRTLLGALPLLLSDVRKYLASRRVKRP